MMALLSVFLASSCWSCSGTVVSIRVVYTIGYRLFRFLPCHFVVAHCVSDIKSFHRYKSTDGWVLETTDSMAVDEEEEEEEGEMEEEEEGGGEEGEKEEEDKGGGKGEGEEEEEIDSSKRKRPRLDGAASAAVAAATATSVSAANVDCAAATAVAAADKESLLPASLRAAVEDTWVLFSSF